MVMNKVDYMNFWGKADAESGRWHPLAYHMLNGAVLAFWMMAGILFMIISLD